MASIEHRALLPTTRSGAVGALLAAFSVVAFAAASAHTTPTIGRDLFAVTWLIVLASGVVELFAILRRRERSLVGFAALLPLGLLLVLLVMEATGLME